MQSILEVSRFSCFEYTKTSRCLLKRKARAKNLTKHFSYRIATFLSAHLQNPRLASSWSQSFGMVLTHFRLVQQCSVSFSPSSKRKKEYAIISRFLDDRRQPKIIGACKSGHGMEWNGKWNVQFAIKDLKFGTNYQLISKILLKKTNTFLAKKSKNFSM